MIAKTFKVKIKRINSKLGIILPKKIVEEYKLKEGQKVIIDVINTNYWLLKI